MQELLSFPANEQSKEPRENAKGVHRRDGLRDEASGRIVGRGRGWRLKIIYEMAITFLSRCGNQSWKGVAYIHTYLWSRYRTPSIDPGHFHARASEKMLRVTTYSFLLSNKTLSHPSPYPLHPCRLGVLTFSINTGFYVSNYAIFSFEFKE